MSELQFVNVSKCYNVPKERAGYQSGQLVQNLKDRFLPNTEKFWALRDITFNVGAGETVGIIGHNGAGKSTILKILSRITAPSEGAVRIRGRLAALLEVGSGFHPELTGRENIFLSASILGMRRTEVQAQLESIIDFAEIRNFVDLPVKRYSSGMYVRLGFAIAAHLRPNILLLDEVLAVGDAMFQQKCLARVEKMRADGITIIFISHDLKAVRSICSRLLLMQRGVVIGDGSPEEIIRQYQQNSQLVVHDRVEEQRLRFGLPNGKLTSIQVFNADNQQTSILRNGHSVRILIDFHAYEPVPASIFVINICALDSVIQCQFSTGTSTSPIDIPVGIGQLEFTSESLPLQPGSYYLDIGWLKVGASHALDWRHNCKSIQVESGPSTGGLFFLPQSYRFLGLGQSEIIAPGSGSWVERGVGEVPDVKQDERERGDERALPRG